MADPEIGPTITKRTMELRIMIQLLELLGTEKDEKLLLFIIDVTRLLVGCNIEQKVSFYNFFMLWFLIPSLVAGWGGGTRVEGVIYEMQLKKLTNWLKSDEIATKW